MNLRPILIATCCAFAFVAFVYLFGKQHFSLDGVTDQAKPHADPVTVGIKATSELPRVESDTDEVSEATNSEQTTQEPVPTVDTEVNDTTAESETPITVPTPIASTEQVHLSPFGFGPLPKVPADFPEQNVWEEFLSFYSKYGPEIITEEHELINRVHIKLWTQGERPTGISMENGMVYPEYSDVIYMTRETLYADDGTIEGYKANVSAPEGITDEQIDALTDDGITPEGYTVIPHTEAMFDPYVFLNLK